MIKKFSVVRGLFAVVIAVSLIAGSDRASAGPGDVEQRIAAFWARVNAMQPGDYLSSADIGQWALNVIERNSRVRMTVADFRVSTADMQGAMDRAGLAAAGATQPPAPTPTPATGAFTFGSGTKIVGTDIAARTYRTRTAASGCYWKRLSGFSGTFAEVIASDITDYPTVVTIASTDRGFDSSSCATWTTDLSPITSSPTAPFTNGQFIVNTDIAAGTWTAPGGPSCYWKRLNGFSGEFKDIIANDLPSGTAVVTIAASDRGFAPNGCGSWAKIG